MEIQLHSDWVKDNPKSSLWCLLPDTFSGHKLIQANSFSIKFCARHCIRYWGSKQTCPDQSLVVLNVSLILSTSFLLFNLLFITLDQHGNRCHSKVSESFSQCSRSKSKWKQVGKSQSTVNVGPGQYSYSTIPLVELFHLKNANWHRQFGTWYIIGSVLWCKWASQVALMIKDPQANAKDIRDVSLIPG